MIQTEEMPVDITEEVIKLDDEDLVLAQDLQKADVAGRQAHAKLFNHLREKYKMDASLPHRLDTKYIDTGSVFLTKLVKKEEPVTDPNAQPPEAPAAPTTDALPPGAVVVEEVNYEDLPKEVQAQIDAQAAPQTETPAAPAAEASTPDSGFSSDSGSAAE